MVSVFNWDNCFKTILLQDYNSTANLKTAVLTALNELYSHPVNVSRQVYDEVKSKFNRERELGWMLFSKDNIITKAVESTKPGGRMSYSFDKSQVIKEYTNNNNQGFELIGTAHFHTLPSWRYKGEFSSPKLASNSDFGIFHKHFPGLSYTDLDEGLIQKISNLERVILLGSRFDNEDFIFRAFLAIGNIKYYESNNEMRELSSDESALLSKNINTLYEEHCVPFPDSLRSEEPISNQKSMVELPIKLV
ncbi:Uncharacterised protein [Candidatus Tiddalikarchaeum anstoanum]|nr:Uncharacterised protein [Candidatus Tiddalikarchaeum anstoanum]